MIKLNAGIDFTDGYRVTEMNDLEYEHWIVNQIMGETAKGDTLECKIISKGDMWLYTGIVKDKEGTIKILVPTVFLTKPKPHAYMVYECDGTLTERTDSIEAEQRIISRDSDIDQAVREYLGI